MCSKLTRSVLRRILTAPKTCLHFSTTINGDGYKHVRPRKKEPANWETQSWEERIADAVTPLWRMTYDEQLQWKQEKQRKILLKMMKRLDPADTFPSDLSFPLLPIVASPVRDGYRNKSFFSVNRGVDGNQKTVGFLVGTERQKNLICVNGGHLLNMPSTHNVVARCYEDFIRASPLSSCILFTDGGHWRELVIRTNQSGHTMAIVYFHPQSLTPDEIGIHKTALVEYFTQGPGSICQLDSLYFQETPMTRCSHKQSPYQLLHGQPHIYEEVLGFKFRISPDSFFQVNQGAAEALYRAIAELNRDSVGGTLLDVCCGTGAVSISLSHQMDRVIGIELIEQAVEDAKYNAALNGVHNCEFIAGKAEVVLPNLMSGLHSHDALTAIVNPSRAGLHYRVVRALRNHRGIKRLIYVSCKPDGEAMRNFYELCCRSALIKGVTGKAFRPTVAVPVDLFPHTSDCELVIVFER